MADSLHTISIELLSRILNGTIEPCRRDLAVFISGNEARPNHWNILKDAMSDNAAASEGGPERTDNSKAAFLKIAGLRLLDNLALTAQRRDRTAMLKAAEKRLEEARIACMLLAMNSGNAGLPWNSVDLTPSSKSGRLSIRIGTISPIVDDLGELLPELDWNLTIPALLHLDEGQSIFLVGPEGFRQPAIDALHSVALRILLVNSPGWAKPCVLDPLGYSMARPPWSQWPGTILTDSRAIESQIFRLFARMEEIAPAIFGEEPGSSAPDECKTPQSDKQSLPHTILIVHDCPSGLSAQALQKLNGIVRNGGRCGIISLIHWSDDTHGFAQSKFLALTGGSMIIEPDSAGAFHSREAAHRGCRISLDDLPPERTMESIVVSIAGIFREQAARTLDFDDTRKGALASSDDPESSAMGIRAPLGMSEAGKPVSLEFGEGKATHGLIVGGTGSGKSSLMHVIITGLVETYPPDELRLYLIDLKGGVEFKRYAENGLPHADVVAVDCEREFALSTLDNLHQEMSRRMNLFRAADSGTTSVPAFRGSGRKLPRVLLVMDEFQKLFAESDDLADRARIRLESLLKEGRGFGIHVLLGTQSLKGILMRGGSFEQVAARVVLRCGPDDSREALASDNTAASSLPKYHGIYNDQQGRKEGNLQFKAAYLPPDQCVRRLKAIAERSDSPNWKPVVFEGNGMSAIVQCEPYSRLLSDGGLGRKVYSPCVWLGEPIAIQPPVEFQMESARGRNFLALVQNPTEGSGILFNALLSLLAQLDHSQSHFTIFNLLPVSHPHHEWPQLIAGLFKHPIDSQSTARLPGSLSGLVDELNSRIQAAGDHTPLYVFILGLQHGRDFRPKDAYGEPVVTTPAGALRLLLRDGPEYGIHVLVWCDLLANLTRCGRSILDEFGIRMGGRMELSDSTSFIGTPAAARFRSESRAVLVDESHPGRVLTFRPYLPPDFSFFRILSTHQ